MKTLLLTALIIGALTLSSKGEETFRLLSVESQPKTEGGIEPAFFVQLCLGISIVAVGSYVVYELWNCARKLSNTNTNQSNFNYSGPVSQSTDTNCVGCPTITFQWSTNLIDWQFAGSVVGQLDDFYFRGSNDFPKACFFRAVVY